MPPESPSASAAGGAAALPAAATPTAALPPIPPPPEALLLAWLVLPSPPEPDTVHPEARRIAIDAQRGRFSPACGAALSLHERVLAEAAGLFYAPVRKHPNLDGISAFLGRWVRGKAPLLVVVAEVFGPAPSFRDLAVVSCVRALRLADAERVLWTAALEPEAVRQRMRLALLRWRRERDLRAVAWLLDPRDGSPPALALRAGLLSGAARDDALAAAQQSARSAADRALVARAIAFWRASGAR